jgi:diguanylate cyclase (GGDEF)-like protein
MLHKAELFGRSLDRLKPIRFSKVGQTAIIFICSAIILAIPAVLINRGVMDLVVDRLGTDARNVAITTAHLVEADLDSYLALADTLAPPDDPALMAYYQRMLSLFRHLKDAVGADFLYTEKLVSEAGIVYVLDAEDPSGDVFSPNGTEDYLSEYERQAFMTGLPVITKLVDYSDWGEYLTGYAPIRDDRTGEVVGLVGVDYSATSVVTTTTGIRTVIYLTFLILAFLTTALIVFQLRLRYETLKTDYLTGLCTKQYMDLQLKLAVEEAESSKKTFTLGMLDIDSFKLINDQQGHPIGDLALKAVARTIKENLRQIDIVSRYGGDEYVILLPGQNQLDAQVVAFRILENASQMHLTDAGVPKLTLSIGIAQWEPGMTAQQLMVRADQMMYKAKSQGKNRVVSYDDPDPVTVR